MHGRSVSAHEHVGEGKARRDGGLTTRNTSRQTKAGYTNGCNHTAPVAQRIEHPPPKRGAAGSIPAGRATFRSDFLPLHFSAHLNAFFVRDTPGVGAPLAGSPHRLCQRPRSCIHVPLRRRDAGVPPRAAATRERERHHPLDAIALHVAGRAG